jgi:two-component system sensor histidine kinase/response regulator
MPKAAKPHSRDCEVELADNGLEAVNRLHSDAFDVVFMDCQMPILDGLTATRRIRERETGTATERQIIIAMTALAEHRRSSLDAGMDDHITKPITIDKVRGMLDKWTLNLAETHSIYGSRKRT